VTFSIVSGPGTLSGTNHDILTVTGPGTIVVAANQAGNAAYAAAAQVERSVVVTGNETPATMTSPAAGSTLTGSSVTFSWTSEAGATQYYLSVGSTGVGSTNVYNSGWRDVTSWTATGLPTNGETLYLRLSTDYSGTAVHNDYTYKAATAAVLTTPTPDTMLSGSNVTFDCIAGTTGATQYYLSIGSTGVGSSNIYNSGWKDVTSWAVTGLPTNGETLYVRLSTDFGGTVVHDDYTYTAH
jgi:hypothetical protein